MPFSLCNAPATFQSYINSVLSGILDIYCVVYLDNILIFLKSDAEHEEHVKEVLWWLDKYNLYAKLSKCEFHQKEVKYLGFIVGANGMQMDPSQLDTVCDWPEPRSQHNIQVFLGFTSYFQQFIYKYS